MTEQESKLIIAKLKLISEIVSHQSMIDFNIIKGAKSTRELLQNSKTDSGATLSKGDYENILNYLLSVERKSMFNYGDNSHLKDEYLAIQIKQEILNTL